MKSRHLYALLSLPVMATAIVVGLYLFKFGSLSEPALSDHLPDWGILGDYVGGMLGTYFALLAFAGVLLTLVAQHHQLEQLRDQAKLEELQRLINVTSSRADAILDSLPTNPKGQFEYSRLSGRPLSVFTILSIGGTIALDTQHPMADRDQKVAQAKESIRHEIVLMLIEINQLVWCLDRYAHLKAGQDIAAFYKFRYGAVVCWARALKLLPEAAPRVDKYFDPESLAQYLRAENLMQAGPAVSG